MMSVAGSAMVALLTQLLKFCFTLIAAGGVVGLLGTVALMALLGGLVAFFHPLFDYLLNKLGTQNAQHMGMTEADMFNFADIDEIPTPLLTGPLEFFGKMWHSLLETVSQGAQYMNILHDPVRPDGWGAGLLTSYIPAIAGSMDNSTQFAINGDIVIYSQATDAKGIAKDIGSELRTIVNNFSCGVPM
jgi:hypothetical protein